MNTTYSWYCPHCGKLQEGAPASYVIEHQDGIRPLTYSLCKDCAVKHHRWMEGEE